MLLLCIILCLSSCNKEEPNVGIETSPEATSKSSEENTTLKPQKHDLVISQKTVEAYEDYQALLDSADLPDKFVSYEQIRMFGDFRSVWFQTKNSQVDYKICAYRLTDETGFEYSLSVYLQNNLEGIVASNPTCVVNINENDMRRLNTEESGHYDYNNLVYVYHLGLLKSINWEIDGVTYRLTGSLSDYPNVTSTPLGKLIDLKNASTVIDSIS